jgi:hypothetical protein
LTFAVIASLILVSAASGRPDTTGFLNVTFQRLSGAFESMTTPLMTGVVGPAVGAGVPAVGPGVTPDGRGVAGPGVGVT